MRRISLASIAIILIGLSVGAEAQRVPAKGEYWGVVVGVAHERRQYATRDAEAMYDVLVGPLGFKKSNVVLLTERSERKPILKNIVWALGTFLGRSAEKNDTVVIFLAGHGLVEKSDRGLDRYLVAADSDPRDLYSTALAFGELWGALRRLEAENLILFLDVPYSGTIGDGTVREAGRTVLASARSSEVSLEASTLGHGVFTYYLVQALKGEAVKQGRIVSLADVYEQARGQTMQSADRVGGNQHPVLNGDPNVRLSLTGARAR